eukprot:785032-Pyramimonas_sp.AAC.1
MNVSRVRVCQGVRRDECDSPGNGHAGECACPDGPVDLRAADDAGQQARRDLQALNGWLVPAPRLQVHQQRARRVGHVDHVHPACAVGSSDPRPDQ